MKQLNFGNDNTNPSVHIFGRERMSMDYLVTLPSEIGPPENYSQLIALLAFAEDGDTITIEINNGGGHVYTALQIINAMMESKAHITTVLNTEAHSAASLIFLAGHSHGVGKFSSMLCHEGQSGDVGKPSDLRKRLEHYNSEIERILKDTYEGFLTDEEIDKILNGLELLLNDEQIVERLQKREEYFKEKYSEDEMKESTSEGEDE